MQTTIDMLGKKILVQCSTAAERQLKTLAEPLLVEMELYFSCLLRKAVRFGRDAQAADFVEASPNLRIGFRPVMTRVCGIHEFEGEPPLEDFPIMKPAACVPKRLNIDYRKGEWRGEFFLN